MAQTQQLATPEEFFIHGIERSRVKQELLDELETADPGQSTIDAWLRASSGKVLRAFASFLKLPLTDWGDDVKSWVCVLAAYDGKGVLGLPASLEEATQLQQRYDNIAHPETGELAICRRRKEAPQGVVDSSEPDPDDPSSYPQVPITWGYKALKIDNGAF